MPEQAFESDPYASIWLYRTTEQRRSKLGGLPNLPWWLAWPRRKVTANQLAGELARLSCPRWASGLLANIFIPVLSALFRKRRSPLHFLGQIDLSELPALPLMTGGPSLPKTGYLFFFSTLRPNEAKDDIFGGRYWMEFPGGDTGAETRVIYARVAGPERAPPKGLPPLVASYETKLYPRLLKEYPADDPIWRGVFPSHPLAAKRLGSGDDYPVPPRYPQKEALQWALVARDWHAKRLGVDIPVTSLDWKDWARYPVALKEHRQIIDGREQVTVREVHSVQHLLFRPLPTVRDEFEWFGSKLQKTDLTELPLMIFDTDWGVHKLFQFGDMSYLQFWIKRRDLDARRFDRCFANIGER
jgi:hypothetical protein